jgi:hypothetical protein
MQLRRKVIDKLETKRVSSALNGQGQTQTIIGDQ